MKNKSPTVYFRINPLSASKYRLSRHDLAAWPFARSFNRDLRALMRRKRWSRVERNSAWPVVTRCGPRKAHLHGVRDERVSAAPRRACITGECRWIEGVTTSLTAANHEDSPVLTGLSLSSFRGNNVWPASEMASYSTGKYGLPRQSTIY